MDSTNIILANLEHLGILTTDTDLNILMWNQWLERYSGKPSSEVIGKKLFSVFPELLERGLDRYYQQAVEGQSSILSQRFHKYLLPLPPTVADSKLRFMQQTARISPLSNADSICGTLTLIEDVTERVVTEQELRQQSERLEEANRQKDDFLAMLAHELRNPLAPIRNGVHLLDQVPMHGPEGVQIREMINRQVSHMSRLIDDLMDVSRIVRGKVRLQKETCDLVVILSQVAEDFRPILADGGRKFELQVPTESCWIEGDPIRIAQIISNLLQNASKFTNQHGTVHLIGELNRDLREFVITVADNGIGMSPDVLAHVFEAFSQAESSLARSKGGLGLGLALVKGLVELHGGRVDAQSGGIGKGSSFRVRLPITEASVHESRSSAPVNPVAATAKRILVIEDNRDAAISTQLLLRRLGFEVELAFSGPEGIDVARRSTPEIVLCDLGLPGIDGFGVARVLRNEPALRDVFLIAQSGYGQDNDIRKAHESGFDLHLIKPVSFSDLERAVLTAGIR